MKKLTPILLIVVILILVSIGFMIKNKPAVFGSGQESRFNMIDSLSRSSTTTGSFCATCPVKLLDKDFNRRYAIITNISDTTIYLYATTTTLTVDGLEPGTGENAASSTISALDGIPVVANASYEILPENEIYGYIWASSTASSKSINISYK